MNPTNVSLSFRRVTDFLPGRRWRGNIKRLRRNIYTLLQWKCSRETWATDGEDIHTLYIYVCVHGHGVGGGGGVDTTTAVSMSMMKMTMTLLALVFPSSLRTDGPNGHAVVQPIQSRKRNKSHCRIINGK